MANVSKSTQKLFQGRKRHAPKPSDEMMKAMDDFQNGRITAEQFTAIIKEINK